MKVLVAGATGAIGKPLIAALIQAGQETYGITHSEQRRFSVIGRGQGVWNFIHVEDAGKAAADAVYTHPGAYNIVNDRPITLYEWLPAFARHVGAPYPDTITEATALQSLGPDRVYYATKLRGASNAKAKQEYNFQPRTFEWLA